MNQLAKIYAAGFNGPIGGAVLEDLRRRYFNRPSYVKGDPYETAYREGQRSVLISIFNLIAAANPKAVQAEGEGDTE